MDTSQVCVWREVELPVGTVVGFCAGWASPPRVPILVQYSGTRESWRLRLLRRDIGTPEDATLALCVLKLPRVDHRAPGSSPDMSPDTDARFQH